MFLSKLEWLIDYESKIAGKLHVQVLTQRYSDEMLKDVDTSYKMYRKIDKVHSSGDWVVNTLTIRFTLVFKNMVCLAINYYFSTKKSIHLTF